VCKQDYHTDSTHTHTRWQDTYTCLAAGTCEPLGGYSVWSSLPPPPLPTDETAAADNTTAAALPLPTVVVLAKLDAQV
jgi:hypothetical protein